MGKYHDAANIIGGRGAAAALFPSRHVWPIAI